MNSKPIQLLAFVALFAMSAIGFVQLTDYSSRPGHPGLVPNRLSDVALSDTSLSAGLTTDGKPQLLLFYHPKCPCTTATVRILERLNPRFLEPIPITAIAYCADDEPDLWIQSRTTKALSSLDNVRIVIDKGGRLSKSFGATVSGHLLLYNPNGQLTFSGGITPYRGHEGDSPSSLDLLERINSPKDNCMHWPVFGCTTVSPDPVETEQ